MRKSFSTIATTVAAAGLMLSSTASAIGLPQSPREVAENTEYYFNEGDVKGLASLYDEDSIFIEKDGTAIRGAANIEKALAKYLVGKPVMEDGGMKVFGTADTGLILVKWRIKTRNAKGKVVMSEEHGTGTDVVRKRADGRWVYAIDNPYGVEHIKY